MKDLVIGILISVLSYSLGYGTLMRKVISGRVDIDAVIGFTPAEPDLIPTVARCHRIIAAANIPTTAMEGARELSYARLVICIEVIMDWAESNGVDMEAILRAKHEYNKTRPYRHGGKPL